MGRQGKSLQAQDVDHPIEIEPRPIAGAFCINAPIWMIFAFIAVSIAAIIVAYFAAVQLKWL